MARVALLSNPRSTGNRSLLPRVRSFCAQHDDIFHYEVEHVDQIGQALRTIARVKPKVLVINGGDGTVQAALTELYQGGHFGKEPPPVAVLPNGKTKLIALSDGSVGGKPVLGMFLGGAGLADTILFCRHKIYPLGLPNGLSHVLTFFAVILSILFGLRAKFLPPRPTPVKVSVVRRGQHQGRFAFLMVTTLERLLLNRDNPVQGQ